jgi:Recombination enhancement, RecA-dependent nuclease
VKTSLNSPTRYEQERIDAMRNLGCVACAVLGVPNLNHLELHHILDGGVRMGHYFSVFLCRGHHQGDWSQGQLEWIPARKRVAISDGRKRFVKIYGTERSLWEKVQNKLKLPAVWPISKIVPRRLHVEMDSDRVELLARPDRLEPAQPQGADRGAELHPRDLAQDRRDSGVTS